MLKEGGCGSQGESPVLQQQAALEAGVSLHGQREDSFHFAYVCSRDRNRDKAIMALADVVWTGTRSRRLSASMGRIHIFQAQ